MKLRRLFRKERIINALKGFGALRVRVSHSLLLSISLLFLILFMAFLVRLLPIRWGFHLSEFDPYFQYRLTKHMVDNGFFAWLSWQDYMRWYPYGVAVGRSFPGLSGTAAFSYMVLKALGLSTAAVSTSNPLTSDPVFNFCVLFPVMMGTLTCLVIFFLGKDIGGKEVGLFSALFLAFSSAHISRTSLGFFDDETVGVFGILLFFFFFLRSIEIKKPLKEGVAYSVAAGLSLGYLLISWGAALYPLGIAVLFVFVLLLMRRYSSRLLLSYTVTFALALFIAVNIPRLGFSFLTETYVLAVVGVFMLLCMFEVSSYMRTLKMKMAFVFCFFGLLGASFLMLSSYGYIRPIEYKWMTILNPITRFVGGSSSELIQSVQEHRPAAWGSFYYDFGIAAFFIPVGLFFAVRNPTNRNVFLAIFGLTSIYFAGSMVRLTLILAPAISLYWALALSRLLKPFITIMKGVPEIPRRQIGLGTHVGKEFSGAFLAVMLILLMFTFVLPSPGSTFSRPLSHAYSPTTIAAASMPIKPPEPVSDWLDALNWMRVNLQPTDVVASWWDYGYWITIVANKTTLADNGTVNVTQIANIGKIFLSAEAEAVEILDGYDAKYVVVFTTFDSQGRQLGWGDEGKWRWMARIAGLDDKSFGDYTLGVDWVDNNGDRSAQEEELMPNLNGTSAVIYKLMTYGREVTLQGSSNIELEHFEKAYFSQSAASPKDYGGAIPLVCVYKINYT